MEYLQHYHAFHIVDIFLVKKYAKPDATKCSSLYYTLTQMAYVSI